MRNNRRAWMVPAVIALGLLLAACGRQGMEHMTGSGPAETAGNGAAGAQAGKGAQDSDSAQSGNGAQDGDGVQNGNGAQDGNGTQSETGTQPGFGTPGTDGAQADGTGGQNQAGTGASQAGRKNTGASQSKVTAEMIGGSYFKSGDFTYRLRVTPGTPENPDFPVLEFVKRDPNFSNAFSMLHTFRLDTPAADGTYTLTDSAGGQAGSSFTIDWTVGGPVVLHGEMEEAGTYYPVDGNLMMPELFARPLNQSDLIGLTQDELKLMRNQFYAVYGREFKTEAMKTYFESQPWYKARFGADGFNELLLGGLERRNIAFLKAAEDSFDEAQAREIKSGYAALPPAPYEDLLPERGEIWVELYSDAGHTVDRGLYYQAKGTISVPITITRDQYISLNEGTQLELVSDGLTGETVILRKAQDTQYGDYVLIDPKNPDEASGTYVNFSYEPYSQTFSMWTDSVDTVFKTVYEGNVFVLKGACEEYYNYFNLSERPQGAGAFRVMEFNENDPYGPSPYMGNQLVTDAKGYIKALYFMGD